MRPLIGPVHDVLIGPFEIKCINEGFAQPLVLEFFASRVEEPALRARGCIVGDDVALDASFADSRKVVARCPGARGEFLPEPVASCGENLAVNFAIDDIYLSVDIKILLTVV